MGTRAKAKSVAHNLQLWWSVLGLSLVMVVLCELGLRSLVYIDDVWLGRVPPEPPERHSVSPGADTYGGATWAVKYYEELNSIWPMDWHPYVYWRRQPFQGVHINIDERGLRKTWNPPQTENNAQDPVRIFFFGGSTMWGWGARDDETIPSHVSRLLTEAGHRVEVTNFGEIGYVSTQGVIALMRCLQQGDVPDIVVFMEGVNDVLSAYRNKVAGVSIPERRRQEDFNLSKDTDRLRRVYLGKAVSKHARGFLRAAQWIQVKLLGKGTDSTGKNPKGQAVAWDQVAQETTSVFERNVQAIKLLTSGYGCETVFYFQPTLFTKQHMTAFEAERAASMAYMKGFFLNVYKRVASSQTLKQGGVFRDISGVFDRSKQPYFVDYCHLAGDGCLTVAQEMVKDLELMVAAHPKASAR